MNNFTFEYPYFLILIILFLICDKFCKAKVSSISIPHIAIYKSLGSFSSTLLLVLKYISIVFILISLASPVVENSYKSNSDNGYNIVLLLDSSGSMRELGFGGNSDDKFKITQELVQSFIKKRVHDNLGIVVFGTTALVASPLSFDKQMLQTIVQRLSIGIAGEKTAINDAIASGVNLLKDVESKNRVLILLTDGFTSAGSIPLDVALKLSLEHQVKIYTIAIGREGEFDEVALDEIATTTGGKFFVAKNREILQNIYDKINELEKSEIRAEKIVDKKYYYQYSLLIAILSLIFYIYFKNKKGI